LFGDLQSKLERNEARNRELENALSSEMGKTLRLEEDKRILDEIRRVLGADISRPSEHVEAATPVDTRREEPDNTNNELLIDTQYGEWIFRPPFALEEDEIELLRLVAGEDEITAEQIRRKTDRRRATDNLDDLLDRLADESLEPIKEINDRYSFDPNFLQD
jgi:GAF domain-containing protein